ncbi:MAG: hypothetical protein GX596_05220 [Propionibacterium sp.]|nr:hypothetical protein [Propionibacterium sp.]
MTATTTTRTSTEGNHERLTATGEGLRRALDGPFHATKQRWRREVDAEDIARSPDFSVEEARAWALEKVVALSGRDFVTAGFPEAYGGTGSLAESVANFEMLAMGDLSLTIKSGVQHGLYGGAIMNLGTKYHHDNFLSDAVTVRTPGCFAMTELDHGSDVQNLETTITYIPESQEFEIHSPHPRAAKAYIGNAARDGRMAVVFGQLIVGEENHGVHAILVPIRDSEGLPLPRVTTGDHGHKGGLNGVDNGTILFEHVRVPRLMLLDKFGGVDEDGAYHSPIKKRSARFFTMLGTLVRGRICVGGGAASAGRKALSIATRYALERKQFPRPNIGDEIRLIEYQLHQRKLLPEIARAYAFGFAQNEVSLQLQRLHDADAGSVESRELETRAAGLKMLQTRWANDTVQVAREACGGAGYMSENGITLTRHDVDIFATFEGDNTALALLVAKALLLDYRATWGDLNLRDTAQKTAALVGTAILERTTARAPIERLIKAARGKSEAEQLSARGWHIQMFDFREKHIVEGLAQRMRAAAKASEEGLFAAVNACQSHMVAAARAHMDRVVLEAFIAGIEACQDDYIRSLLVRVCDLYALATLEEHRAWYMEHNAFDGKRSKGLTSAVEDLGQELAGKALELVEGLGVPTAWLNSTIA